MKSASQPRHSLLAACCLLPVLPSFAHALDIESSHAAYTNKHYEYELVAIIDAPVDRVQAVLRNYKDYKDLDPRILEARVIARPAAYVAILETTVRACFGPFCRNVKRVER